MAYTYMWLRNDSVVSGQNSFTYSFSPLLVVYSVKYSCQVSLGSLSMTSEAVNIIVGGKLGNYFLNKSFNLKRELRDSKTT